MYIFECKLEIEAQDEDYVAGTLPNPHGPASEIPKSRSTESYNREIMKALEGADHVNEVLKVESRSLHTPVFSDPIFTFMSIDIAHAQQYVKKLFPYFADQFSDDHKIGDPYEHFEWYHVDGNTFGSLRWTEGLPLTKEVRMDNIWAIKRDGIVLYLIAIPVDQMTDLMKVGYFDKVCVLSYEIFLRYVIESLENEVPGSRGMLSDPDKDLSIC